MTKPSRQKIKKGDLVAIKLRWSEQHHAWMECEPFPGIVLDCGGEFITVLADGRKQFLLGDEIEPVETDGGEG
jgi:hypothetical protein